MGFYDKQIQYLDLWEYGEKVGNAGFIKIDVRDEECKIWISVKGIYQVDVLVARIMLIGDEGEWLADQMILHQGMGTYAAKWETNNLAQTNLEYLKWEGVRLVLSEHRYIEKKWVVKQESSLVGEKKEIAHEETPVVENSIEISEEVQIPALPKQEEEVAARPALNKWSMLGQYYKKKKPFGDDKEYLCISPEDLILLPEKYEHLYKNSFLLHAYYAYGHLLLGALDVQNRNIYRLYIPGLGHDKEQIVANMFGFGNFMPVGQQSNRLFGYYYMTVEL